MADEKYSYYKYLKKYSPYFLNKYENWGHLVKGRKTNFGRLLMVRAYLLLTHNMTILPGYRTTGTFYLFGAILTFIDLYGIWYSQEIYNKYSFHKWTHYQPWHQKDTLVSKDQEGKVDVTEEKRPITRVIFSDKVKIVYDGKEEENAFGRRRIRYR
jgi:hypothetical protein